MNVSLVVFVSFFFFLSKCIMLYSFFFGANRMLLFKGIPFYTLSLPSLKKKASQQSSDELNSSRFMMFYNTLFSLLWLLFHFYVIYYNNMS